MVFLNKVWICQEKKLMDLEKINILKHPSGTRSCLTSYSGKVFGSGKAEPEEKAARKTMESSQRPEE